MQLAERQETALTTPGGPAAPWTEQGSQTRRFKPHPKLLLDVIKRQAGTLAKAIVEGVMNSVDAGATACHVALCSTSVRITDDGRGITSREEVEQHFETFGQPHEEAERKTYGTFRMGRGQMFAFGKNEWRTGPFRLLVDVKHQGLDYLLVLAEPSPGCDIRIELYEELEPSKLQEQLDAVTVWVKYAPIPVLLNGVDVTQDPAGEKWDAVTADAYVRLTPSGSLAVYNLGIHTLDLGGYRLGCGGVVVSRRQLKVNFARNDIQHDCPVWRTVKDNIDAWAQRDIVKKETLTDDERRRMAKLVALGRVDGMRTLKLFTASNGRHYSAKELSSMVRRFNLTMTSAPAGDPLGDRIHQQKVALVLSRDTLDRFGARSLGDLIRILDQVVGYGVGWTGRPLEELTAGLSETYDLVPAAKYTETERVWVELAEAGLWDLRPDRHAGGQTAKWRRKILVGVSDVANGWTDGETYIALNRAFLKVLPLDDRGVVALGRLLLHELCHDTNDAGTHVHGVEFYEEYHERSKQLGDFVHATVRRLPAKVGRVTKRLRAGVLKALDQRHALTLAAEGVLAAARAQDPVAAPRPEVADAG